MVTKIGQIIEKSGTMTGGGKSVKKGLIRVTGENETGTDVEEDGASVSQLEGKVKQLAGDLEKLRGDLREVRVMENRGNDA